MKIIKKIAEEAFERIVLKLLTGWSLGRQLSPTEKSFSKTVFNLNEIGYVPSRHIGKLNQLDTPS